MLRSLQAIVCLVLLAAIGPLGAVSVYLCGCTGELLSSVEDCRCPCSVSEPVDALEDDCCPGHGCELAHRTGQTTDAVALNANGDCNELLFRGSVVGFVWDRPASPAPDFRLVARDSFTGSFECPSCLVSIVPVDRIPGQARCCGHARPPWNDGPGTRVVHCSLLI